MDLNFGFFEITDILGVEALFFPNFQITLWPKLEVGNTE